MTLTVSFLLFMLLFQSRETEFLAFCRYPIFYKCLSRNRHIHLEYKNTITKSIIIRRYISDVIDFFLEQNKCSKTIIHIV